MGYPFNTRHNHSLSGFTLIEMIVVLAIIIIVTGIAIGGQQNFNRTITLSNTAYSIALALRESQTYGLSSLAQPGLNIRNTGYGLAVTSSTSYVLFADLCPAATGGKPDTDAGKPGNHIYEVGGCSGVTSELVRNYTLNNGFTISKFCALHPNGTTWRCSTDSTELTNLSIKFTRPEAEARISGLLEGATSYLTNYLAGCITVRSPNGETRTVTVSSSGQIAVTTNTCGV